MCFVRSLNATDSAQDINHWSKATIIFNNQVKSSLEVLKIFLILDFFLRICHKDTYLQDTVMFCFAHHFGIIYYITNHDYISL